MSYRTLFAVKFRFAFLAAEVRLLTVLLRELRRIDRLLADRAFGLCGEAFVETCEDKCQLFNLNKGFDEITEFTETQYLFITGWNRSTDPDQRVRVVVTGNPPSDDVGTWVLRRWAPWLDPKHPNPAEPGELRWYATIDGEEQEFPDGGMKEIDGEKVFPKSRTFIPASLADNPYYAHSSQYIATLQSLPEPLRSQLLYGDFSASISEDAWQAIPTRWVRLAQQRWVDSGKLAKQDDFISAVGVDPSRGGMDFTAVAHRYGVWFDEVTKIHARVAKDGPKVAEQVRKSLKGKTLGIINVDVIGIGASVFDSLVPMFSGKVRPINVSEKIDAVSARFIG